MQSILTYVPPSPEEVTLALQRRNDIIFVLVPSLLFCVPLVTLNYGVISTESKTSSLRLIFSNKKPDSCLFLFSCSRSVIFVSSASRFHQVCHRCWCFVWRNLPRLPSACENAIRTKSRLHFHVYGRLDDLSRRVFRATSTASPFQL